tara:strand:+ start:342 stop:719 length:378 start_codon:yes stop_codon:yes gene_type:complete
MKIHHIGYVVENINNYADNFPYLQVNKIVKDIKQNARIGLFKNLDTKIFIELIEPLNQRSYTWGFLQKGGGIHHICYINFNLKKIEIMKKKYKLFHLLGPINSKLFEKKVIFFMTQEKQIIEFIL